MFLQALYRIKSSSKKTVLRLVINGDIVDFEYPDHAIALATYEDVAKQIRNKDYASFFYYTGDNLNAFPVTIFSKDISAIYLVQE